MKGFAPLAILTGACALVIVCPAGAWWHGNYVSYYSYPVTAPVYYYYPVYVAAPLTSPCITAPPASTIYAQPRPAPPSGAQTAEPPSTSKRAPDISEMRSGSKYPPMDDGERCRVGFWNVSGRDVTIKVNGQARLLPSNRSVTLDLGRDFVWQLDEREPQRQQVPSGQATYEIILRR